MKTFAKKLGNTNKEIVDKCLTKYMNSCKQKHAMAFFQWRAKFGPTSGREGIAAVINEIFESRMRQLQLQDMDRVLKHQKIDQSQQSTTNITGEDSIPVSPNGVVQDISH